MSILGNRGGNAQDKTPSPLPAHLVRKGPEPERTAPPPAIADPHALHPAVQQHAIAWSQMLQEADKLRVRVQQLTNELIVERENSQRVEMALEFERGRTKESDRWREVYQRYAVEIHSGLRDGMVLIERAMAKAMELAQKQNQDPLDRVEIEAKRAVEVAVGGDGDGPMPTDTSDARAD